MRNISFALTTDQIRRRTKTVTRRLKWENLVPGQLLCGVVKGMGLKPGEEIERLAVIRVVSVEREALGVISKADVVREGFPHMSPADFVSMFTEHMRCSPFDFVTRIEFQYVPGGRF